MIKEFKLPELAEGVESAVVVSLSVAEGDAVTQEQTVAELENSKATAEIPVPFGGTIKKIFKAVGDEILVGETLLSVELAEEAAVDGEQRDPAPTTPPAKDDTDSASAGPPAAAATAAAQSFSAAHEPDVAITPAGPEVRRMARELGIDLFQVTGHGPRGRITVDDVKSHAKSVVSGTHSSPPATPGASPQAQGGYQPRWQPTLPNFTPWGTVTEHPMTGIRHTTADVTSSSWQQIPLVTQHDLADVSDFKSLREQWRAMAEKHGTKLTMTALLLKVTSAALKLFPRFNCSVDMENRKLIYKDFVNLAVAVDAGHGLLTPVIFNADQKGVFAIASELSALAKKAKDKKITIEEMSGSTFAVSNLGALGTTSFGPLVTWPHVAALGVSKADIRPLWQNDGFVPRTMLPLSVSYDHRANDGADAARFLRWICEGMADPMKLIMEAG